MGDVRLLQQSDIHDVIRLFQTIFRKDSRPPPPELSAYLQRLYGGFATEKQLSSKVLTDKDGKVVGFMGVNEYNYLYEGRYLKSAMVSTLMVENHERNPLGGVKLMRTLQDGSYDLILTETASQTAAALWKKLDATQLTNYSLDWLRIIRPAGFMTDMVSSKVKPLKLLKPLANLIDNRRRKSMGGKDLRWSTTPENWPAAQALECVPVDKDEFVSIYLELTKNMPCRPFWDEAQLLPRLEDALYKPDYGQPYMIKAATKSGATIGLFLYHLRAGKTARVLELIGVPKARSQLIDTMIHHAARNGAVAIRGRTQPDMMEAMLGKRIAFTHLASTMVWSKDPSMSVPFVEGKAVLNGLAGEHWCQLYGVTF